MNKNFEMCMERLNQWAERRTSLNTAIATVSVVVGELFVAQTVMAPPTSEPAVAYAPELDETTPSILAAAAPDTTTTTAPPETTTTPPTTMPETTLQAATLTSPNRGKIGADLAWPPNNMLINLPSGLEYGIVNVTNGHPLETYAHLPQIIEKFRVAGIEGEELAAYANTSLDSDLAATENDPNVPCPWQAPAEATALCPSYRWGYRGGIFAVEAGWEAGIKSDVWYLDVEGGKGRSGNIWSENYDLNRVALLGTMDAVRVRASELLVVEQADIYIAIYSNTSYWNHIMGADFKLPGIHAWYAGFGPLESLDRFCDDPQYNFTGGGVVMVQSVLLTPTGENLDYDRTC